MSDDEYNKPRIADDYASIAQQLNEIESQKIIKCSDCFDVGWIASDMTTSGWSRCHCDASYEKRRPPVKLR